MKKLVLVTAALVAAVAVFVGLTLPPRALPLTAFDDGTIRGIVHVHSNRSDGLSSPDEKISELVRAHFKLTPRGIIESLDLRRPIYKKTAAFGHFGRTEPEFSWERTDKAEAIRADAGIASADAVKV